VVLLVEVPDVTLLHRGEHGGNLGDRLLLGRERRLQFADLGDDVRVTAHCKV